MNTSHLAIPTSPVSPRTGSPRRVRRLAFAALAGVALASVATTAGASAGAAPAAAARACNTPNAATYTVASGDSWFGVATGSGVSTKALLRANGATASAALQPGDVLCLPAGASTSLSSSSLSTSPAPTPTQSSCASKHTVARGDSWFAISQAAGVSLSVLLRANNAKATTVLQPGAELCLPEGSTPVSTARSCVDKRTVAAGDSWNALARSTGVPIDALVAANKATQSSPIFPGQSLCLPEAGFGGQLPSVPLQTAPVRGACRFANSFHASRGGGRLHVGVDLISPSGTPVVAVANGVLTRSTTMGARSGNAWWLTTSTGTYFFYAHLSRFASGLSVGSHVHVGDVIGYVGSTGNAVSPHLHFEIHPKGGGPINPYSAIWMIGGCNYDRRYEQTPLS